MQTQQVLGEKRAAALSVIHDFDKKADDKNYLFLYYVLHSLPHGIIGLLIAIIFLASMSTTASEINALASVSIVDVYKRFLKKDGSDAHYVKASRLMTVLWAFLSVGFALTLQSTSTLIEAINQIGSLFYGVILGIFLLVFYAKHLRPGAVLWAVILSEAGVLTLHFVDIVSYLWYTVFGCLSVIGVSYLLHYLSLALGQDANPNGTKSGD